MESLVPPSQATPRHRLARWRRDAESATEDLPVLAWLQAAAVLLGATVFKWRAVTIAFPSASVATRSGFLCRVMPVVLALAAAMFLLALACGRGRRLSHRLRALVVVALEIGLVASLFAWYADVEFFHQWGAPLSLE